MSHDLNHRDDFDRLIGQVFAEQTSAADAHVWENIEAALQPKKSRGAFWWWTGAAASVVVLLTCALLWSNQSSKELENAPILSSEEIRESSLDSVISSEIAEKESTDFRDLKLEVDVEKREKSSSTHDFAIQTNHNRALSDDFFKNAKQVNVGSNANQPRSIKPLNTPSKLMDGSLYLEYMPMLVAELDTIKAEHYPLARNLPRYVDFEPLKPVTSDYLAANYASGSGTTAYGNNFEASRMGFGTNYAADNLPTALQENNTFDDTETKFQAPFSIGFRGAKSISNRWFIESGLGFSILNKDVSSPSGQFSPKTIRDFYVGVPLLFDYEFVQRRKLSLMATSGWQIEKGLATREILKDNSGRGVTYGNTPGVQLGWVFGLSTEYRINQQLGLYFQPMITYWMYSSSGIENIRNYTILWPNIQMGLKYRIP